MCRPNEPVRTRRHNRGDQPRQPLLQDLLPWRFRKLSIEERDPVRETRVHPQRSAPGLGRHWRARGGEGTKAPPIPFRPLRRHTRPAQGDERLDYHRPVVRIHAMDNLGAGSAESVERVIEFVVCHRQSPASQVG
jgi:hypothetical protein